MFNCNDFSKLLALMLIRWNNLYLEFCILSSVYYLGYFIGPIVLHGDFFSFKLLHAVFLLTKEALTYFQILHVHRCY